MDDQKLKESKQKGIHHQLNLMAGEWEGITRVWFVENEIADESPMQGTIRSILDGRFLLHEYEGSFKEL